MEIQFEQNRDFNQSHREGNHQKEHKESRQPQGEEGNPNQRLVKRAELDTDEKELDRRPADVEGENPNNIGDANSSAIAGVQNDQQNSTRSSSKPFGENTERNTEIENKKKNDGNE